MIGLRHSVKSPIFVLVQFLHPGHAGNAVKLRLIGLQRFISHLNGEGIQHVQVLESATVTAKVRQKGKKLTQVVGPAKGAADTCNQ